MKYRISNELTDLLEVVSSQRIDVNKHNVPDYDIDIVLAHAAKHYTDEEYKVDKDYISTLSYSSDQFYRVTTLKFTGGGVLTMFGTHRTVEGYRIITDEEYKKLTQTPEEKANEEKKKSEDDKPLDLSEIPF